MSQQPYSPFGFYTGVYNPVNPQSYTTPVQYGPHYDVTRVHGKEGMEKLPMAPNSQGLFLDETQAVIWFAQTDGGGYKTMTPYAIAPLQEAKPVDTATLEARITKLEELMNVRKSDTGADGTGGNGASAGA